MNIGEWSGWKRFTFSGLRGGELVRCYRDKIGSTYLQVPLLYTHPGKYFFGEHYLHVGEFFDVRVFTMPPVLILSRHWNDLKTYPGEIQLEVSESDLVFSDGADILKYKNSSCFHFDYDLEISEYIKRDCHIYHDPYGTIFYSAWPLSL